MDYQLLDSSGTDDDLPQSHQNRVVRGVHISGNGRSGVDSLPFSNVHSEMDIQIRNLEQEAYSSVLRAFKAQSDALTWEKEGLITELRKELRVSDEKHRELLARVNADDVIQKIRDWRQTGGHQAPMLNSPHTISSSRKKQKLSQSMSLGAPPTTSHIQPPGSWQQSSFERGNSLGSRTKMSKTYPSGPTSRGNFPSRVSSGPPVANDHTEAVASDPLIGRKVMTRWPEANNFYEAVIADYDPQEGQHRLIYENQTEEWVNLQEMPSENIRWVGEDLSLSFASGQARGLKKPLIYDSSVAGRGRGFPEGQSRKEQPHTPNGIVKKVPEDIEIYHTDTLIKELEKVLDASQPDPSEMEAAKRLLKEHEQALVDAIARLADLSDGESDGEQEQEAIFAQ